MITIYNFDEIEEGGTISEAFLEEIGLQIPTENFINRGYLVSCYRRCLF